MFEMSKTRKNHGDSMLVSRRDGFFVPDGAARLNDCRDAELRRLIHIIAEREKRVGSENRVFQR